MTTVVQLPERKSLKGYVAGEVRAELSRARVSVARLPHLVGKSQSYWSRRVNGVTALDLEDLEQLATLLNCSIGQFLPPNLLAAPGPDGPGGVWAPSGSNRRPTDYNGAVRPR